MRPPSPRMRGADPRGSHRLHGRDKACSALATSPPNPNIFHPFPSLLQQARLHRLPTAPWTAGQTALHITAEFPSKEAFASEWLSAGCDLQFSL